MGSVTTPTKSSQSKVTPPRITPPPLGNNKVTPLGAVGEGWVRGSGPFPRQPAEVLEEEEEEGEESDQAEEEAAEEQEEGAYGVPTPMARLFHMMPAFTAPGATLGSAVQAMQAQQGPGASAYTQLHARPGPHGYAQQHAHGHSSQGHGAAGERAGGAIQAQKWRPYRCGLLYDLEETEKEEKGQLFMGSQQGPRSSQGWVPWGSCSTSNDTFSTQSRRTRQQQGYGAGSAPSYATAGYSTATNSSSGSYGYAMPSMWQLQQPGYVDMQGPYGWAHGQQGQAKTAGGYALASGAAGPAAGPVAESKGEKKSKKKTKSGAVGEAGGDGTELVDAVGEEWPGAQEGQGGASADASAAPQQEPQDKQESSSKSKSSKKKKSSRRSADGSQVQVVADTKVGGAAAGAAGAEDAGGPHRSEPSVRWAAAVQDTQGHGNTNQEDWVSGAACALSRAA